MTVHAVPTMLAAERAELVALLRDLSEDEWECPSLCEGWRVREVAGHVLHDTIRPATYAGIVVRHRCAVDRVNDTLAAKAAAMPTSRIVDKLEHETGRLSRWAPGVVLADLVVHQQDIRRPLDRPRLIAEDRLRFALEAPGPVRVPPAPHPRAPVRGDRPRLVEGQRT